MYEDICKTTKICLPSVVSKIRFKFTIKRRFGHRWSKMYSATRLYFYRSCSFDHPWDFFYTESHHTGSHPGERKKLFDNYCMAIVVTTIKVLFRSAINYQSNFILKEIKNFPFNVNSLSLSREKDISGSRVWAVMLPFDPSIFKLGFKLGMSAHTKKRWGANEIAFWRWGNVSLTDAWLIN